MSKHSRGPYTPSRSGDGKCTRFFTRDERICEPVFVVDHDDITEEGAPVVKANMKLLAAAPELLDAAHAAWNCIGELPPTQARVEVGQLLSAAIAKATGEA